MLFIYLATKVDFIANLLALVVRPYCFDFIAT